MKHATFIICTIAALTGGQAFAQTANVAVGPVVESLEAQSWDQNFTLSDAATLDETGSLFFPENGQSFQFGGSGRWSMDVQTLTRTEESLLPREEMSAGAMYQFTPRFSFGGSVTVGASDLEAVDQWEEQDIEAGVKLKSTFKF